MANMEERSSAECSSTGSAWLKNAEGQNKEKIVQQIHNCEVIIGQLILENIINGYWFGQVWVGLQARLIRKT